MKVEKISIYGLTAGILLSIGFFAILLSFFAGAYFRSAVLDSQKKTLSRVIEVANQSVFANMRKQVISIGNSFQQRSVLREEVKGLKNKGTDRLRLIRELDDPFIKGFVGTADIDLVKLRVYGTEYQFLEESSFGLEKLPGKLPDFILSHAIQRTGADRLKAIGGLWVFEEHTPIYSILLPIGGLHLIGYLEVITKPVFNLTAIETITQKPLSIYRNDGQVLYQSKANYTRDQNSIPVEYTVFGKDQKKAYRLVIQEDVSRLYQDINRTQLVTTVGFLCLTVLSLLMAFFLFRQFLFIPLKRISSEMERVTQGDLDTKVDSRGLKDFHALATSFNTMTQIVQGNIRELKHLSLVDSVTGIANRCHFDKALDREWLRSRREMNDLSLILLDIDFFKQFNDTYGHSMGDDCIRLIAHTIEKSIHRPTDLACRYGGEEFAIILPDTPLEGAVKLAEKIQAQLKKMAMPHKASAVSKQVTVSIGIACKSANEITPRNMLIEFADKALYKAKESGHNRIEKSE